MSAQTTAPPQFIRSPKFDTIELPPAPAAMPAAPLPAPVLPVAATAAPPAGAKEGIKAFITDPKKRGILIAVALLLALAIGLYLVHRSFKRKQRKIDEDEEALEELAAGQHERPAQQQQQQQPGQGLSIVPNQGGYAPPANPDYDQQMASSLREDQRRQQDMQFRHHQQQMQSGGGFPPEMQRQAFPASPGMLPDLGVNPSAGASGGGGGGGGPPVPGSPDDMGFTPV